MTLFVLFALLTAGALGAVMLPVLRRANSVDKGGTDIAVYRDQLDEVDRDLARGVISATEAEAARVEIQRRLLAATDGQEGGMSAATPLRPVLAAVLIAVPAVAVGGYLLLGNPQLEGQPLAARQSADPERARMAELVGRVESHLRENPEDGRGWEVIAPVYASMGRLEESVTAYRSAIRLLGSTSARQADLGEVITMKAGGVINEDARTAFEMAEKLNPPSVKAKFYLALADEQDGDLEAARLRWANLVEEAPPDAPWRREAETRLAGVRAQLGETPPGPSAEDVAAASEMDAEDRSAMIEGMIAQLDQRLAEEGGSPEEWVRLIRSYMVIEKAEEARSALERARAAMADSPAALAQINAAAGTLGLDG